MGRWFEEFELGFSITTPGRTIGEGDVMLFAGLTGDLTELHTNEEYARTTEFGRRIAHGALVFGVSVGLTTRTNVLDGTLVAFSRVDNLRFTRPVFIGDTVTVTKKVIATADVESARGLLTFDTRVRNQRGETVLAYVDQLLVKRRAADSPTVEEREPAVACRRC